MGKGRGGFYTTSCTFATGKFGGSRCSTEIEVLLSIVLQKILTLEEPLESSEDPILEFRHIQTRCVPGLQLQGTRC